MPEIISTLCTHDLTGGGGIDERENFTVNLAALDVPMNVIAVGQGLLRPGIFGGVAGYKLQNKDNFNILSCGVIMPYHFGGSVEPFTVYFSWADGVGTGNFSNVGDAGALVLPGPSFELACGIYVPWPSGVATGAKVALYMTILSGRVSMIGADPGLAAVTLPVTAWVKISHNLGLVV